MTTLDPAEIKKQLHELNQERKEVEERLKNTDRKGRQPSGPRSATDAEPPLGPSLFDRIVRNGGDGTEEGQLHNRAQGRGSKNGNSEQGGPQGPPASHEERRRQQQDDELRAAKRPAPDADTDANPALKKRNARMFGALMGTLRKFKSDEAQLQDTDAQQRRRESLKRAASKSQESAAELRRKEQQKQLSARHSDIDRRRQLSNDAELKRLELIYAQREGVEAKAALFLKTTTSPPVMWLPMAHNAATHRMLEDRHTGFEAWKVEHMTKLEADKAAAKERHREADARIQARREEAAAAAIARRAAGEDDDGEEQAAAQEEADQRTEEAEDAMDNAANGVDDSGHSAGDGYISDT